MHLITQMNYRLKEGHGEAVYRVGVERYIFRTRCGGFATADGERRHSKSRVLAGGFSSSSGRISQRCLIKRAHAEVPAQPDAQGAGYRLARARLVREEEWAQETQRAIAEGPAGARSGVTFRVC